MASDLTSELSVPEIRELFDHVEGAFRPDRELADRMLELYWGKHKVKVPDTKDKRRIRKVAPERMVTEEASRIVRLIHSLYATAATASVQWWGEGAKGSSAADDIEVAVNEAYDQLNPAHDSPRDRDRFQQVLIGHGAHLGPMPGENYYWDFPKWREGETESGWNERYEEWRKAGPLPFVYVDLPAESTYPASLGLVNDLCLSSMKVTYWDLREMFSPEELGSALGEAVPKAGDTFTLAMASNREYLAYALMDVSGGGFANTGLFRGKNDRPLRSVEHGMGRSVIRIPPGETATKHRTSGGYGHYWMPVLFHVAELIVAADRLYSLAATGAKFDALPILKAWVEQQELSSEGAGALMRHLQEGDVWPLKPERQGEPREDIQAVYQPQHGEHVAALLSFTLGRTERISGAVEAMEGIFTAETAWATNYAVEVATNRRAPLTKNIVAADMDDFEMIMRSTEVHGHNVDLRRGEGGAITLIPEQMAGWRPMVKGEYKLRMPVNQIALYQTGVSMMERAKVAGLPLSPGWVMETMMNIEQPWQHYKEAVAWQAATSPKVFDRLLQHYMDEADAELMEDEGMSLEEMEGEYGRMTPEQQGRAAGATGALRQQGMKAAQGAGRAGAPFVTAPGGPQPQETTPGVTA